MDFYEFVQKTGHIKAHYKITKEVYEYFQLMSGDKNPLHVDNEYAKLKGFPQCVIYGNILNGFVSHFVGMKLPIPDVIIQTQDIQYRRPMFLNDDILVEATIQEESEAVKVVNYRLKFYRINTEKQELIATGHVQVGLLNNK